MFNLNQDDSQEKGDSKYVRLLNRIKANTGINTISLTIDSTGITVDDYSKPECIVQVSVVYNAMQIVSGDNNVVGITDQDLVDFNILPPLSNTYLHQNLPPLGDAYLYPSMMKSKTYKKES